jgi:hypothetical protein
MIPMFLELFMMDCRVRWGLFRVAGGRGFGFGLVRLLPTVVVHG